MKKLLEKPWAKALAFLLTLLPGTAAVYGGVELVYIYVYNMHTDRRLDMLWAVTAVCAVAAAASLVFSLSAAGHWPGHEGIHLTWVEKIPVDLFVLGLTCVWYIYLDAVYYPSATLGHDRKIIRAMPNTPALVNAGMTSVTPNALVTPEDTADVLNIFRCFGEAEVIAEPMIHPVVGVSGSSPAYVFMFIEAMADAAVLGGMPRAQAYKFAAQAVMGSAKMVLETGEHPGTLKDMVCSPGGTTIEAVRVLEEKGFRAAVIEAMTKCMEKSEKLSKS